MSITRINTNPASLLAQNYLAQADNRIQNSIAKLSSGMRIVKAADDPSGSALVASFKAQLGENRTVQQNVEDALSMLQVADTAMSTVTDNLLRMKDLAIRAADDATVTTAMCQAMDAEFQELLDTLNMGAAVSFNDKNLFSGAIQGDFTFGTGSTMASFSIPIISGSDTDAFAGLATNIATANIGSVNAAADAMGWVQSALDAFTRLQANVGQSVNNMENLVSRLQNEEVNLAAVTSRIADTDMAAEISEFTTSQILAQAATAMVAQANLQPQSVLSLFGF